MERRVLQDGAVNCKRRAVEECCFQTSHSYILYMSRHFVESGWGGEAGLLFNNMTKNKGISLQIRRIQNVSQGQE